MMQSKALNTGSLSVLVAAWLAQGRHRLWTAGILLCVLFAVFLYKVNLSDRVDVQYGSDEWDYQAIAVNFATGHGFHIAGLYEKPEVYKFGQVEAGTFEKQELLKGIPNIHRPPLYPLVLGLVYKVTGIHPSAIVILQLLLLCMAAASLPLFGYKLLKTKGFLAGLLSAVVFMAGNYSMANIFLPGQAFTVFFITAFIYATEHFFHKKTAFSAALSAFILGLSLLFHATMILVVGFIGIYLIFALFRQNLKQNMANLSVYVLVLLLVLLPWHLYAYRTLRILKKEAAVTLSLAIDNRLSASEKTEKLKETAPCYGQWLMSQKTFTDSEIQTLRDSLLPATQDKGVFFNNIDSAHIDFFRMALLREILDAPDYFPIFLSITKNMAMDCHNEYIVQQRPIQTWRTEPGSYYNNDGRSGRISFVRVYHFYADNPHQILPLLLYKLNTSLAYSGFLKIFLLLTFFIFTVDLFRLKHKIIIPAFILVSTAALLVLAGPVYQCALLLLLYIPASACQARASGAAQRIPLSFDYIFFSLLIFSVIAMGNQRYFEVLNLFFVFFAFVALVKTVVAFVERKDF